MNTVSDSSDNNGPSHWLARPVRQPWRPFDKAAREDFLNCIREGVGSRDKAAKLCGVHLSTVKAWIARGKLTDYTEDDFEYRLFYLQLTQAETERGAVGETTLHRASRFDWRAADVWLRRQERMEDRAAAKLLVEYQTRRARAEAEEAEHQARLARSRADVAERAAAKIAGAVIFPPEFIEMCTEEERVVLSKALERTRMLVAPQEVVEEALAEQDTSDLDEYEDMLDRHPSRDIKRPHAQDEPDLDEEDEP
ncbi:MAG TPA: hypothetical protein PK095_00215 [Myxococcota bacterium]|nr:hypothetical protein [Myxococcota bacterium]